MAAFFTASCVAVPTVSNTFKVGSEALAEVALLHGASAANVKSSAMADGKTAHCLVDFSVGEKTHQTYLYWTCVADVWQVHAIALAVLGPPMRKEKFPEGSSPSPVPDWLMLAAVDFGDKYNAGDHAGITEALFAETSFAVPPIGSEIAPSAALPGFLAKAAIMLKQLNFMPEACHQEDPATLWELGCCVHQFGCLHYFSRWEQRSSDAEKPDWRIAFSIMNVGEN